MTQLELSTTEFPSLTFLHFCGMGGTGEREGQGEGAPFVRELQEAQALICVLTAESLPGTQQPP